MKKAILFLLGALILSSAQAATLTVVPPTIVSGYPGTTVTWGFTIFNETDYLVVTSAEFPAGSGLGEFDPLDNILIVVGPDVSYNGTARFTIDAGAAPGLSATGPINIYFAVYAVDISTLGDDDPFPDPIVLEDVISANVTVNVMEVPEPRTYLLLAGALALYAATRLRK